MSRNICIKCEVCLEVGGWHFEMEASYAVMLPLQLYYSFSAQGHDKKYTLYPCNILAEKLYFALLWPCTGGVCWCLLPSSEITLHLQYLQCV